MTCIEKYMESHPEKNKGRVMRCYCCYDELNGLVEVPEYCIASNKDGRCADCWNRQFPGTESPQVEAKDGST